MTISFDGDNKRINLSLGTTSLSVRDLWSRWVDWLLTSDNSKYPMAFSNLGGDDIDPTAGTKVPIYAFLLNGWRIKPQEASHTLNVTDGVLLVLGGGDPFVNTTGAYVVRINYQQPVQAISFSSEGATGGLTQAEHDQLMAMEGNIRGADSDTLKTLSDQIDGIELGGGGLTQEEHDELMGLGPTIRGVDDDTLKTLSDQLDVAQTDLDNPNQYKADVSALALETSVQSIKEKTDDLVFTEPGKVDASVDLSGVALEQSVQTVDGKVDALDTGLDALSAVMSRVLGLVQHNFRVKNQVFDSGKRLTSATIRIYGSAADAQNDVNRTGEYALSASYDTDGKCTSYLMRQIA